MAKADWRPSWDREGRVPHWASGEASTNWHNMFGGNKYLWGNTPAVDVLNLEQNEGIEYKRDVTLLFAGRYRFLVRLCLLTYNSVRRFASCCQNNRESPA